MRSSFRRTAALFAAALLSGCAFSEEFAEQAVDYNRTVESAANRQMLLNTLRARDRMPLYFATISKLTGAVTLSIDAGLSADITSVPDVGTTTGITPSTSVTHESSPFFDLAPQMSREFMAGMLRPIHMQLLDYFWQQGWPEELLLYLTVEKVQFDPPIRFCDEDEPISIVRNNPASDVDMARFRKLVLLFRNFYGITTAPGMIHAAVGPLIAADAASGYRPTIAADGRALGRIGPATAPIGRDGLVFSTLGSYASMDTGVRDLLASGKGDRMLAGVNLPSGAEGDPESLYLLAQRRRVHWFQFAEREVGCDGGDEVIKIEAYDDGDGVSGAVSREKDGSVHHPLSNDEENAHLQYSLPLAGKGGKSDSDRKDGAQAEPERLAFRMYMRGTQGIVYYLGELLRRVHYAGKPPIKIDTGAPDLDPSDDEVLFALAESPPLASQDFGLAIHYRGTTYGVAHDPGASPNPAGRTTEVLALLNQLIALNQSSEFLPATTETVISQ